MFVFLVNRQETKFLAETEGQLVGGGSRIRPKGAFRRNLDPRLSLSLVRINKIGFINLVHPKEGEILTLIFNNIASFSLFSCLVTMPNE